MQIPVMMTLLILTLTTWAVLARNPGGKQRKGPPSMFKWCLSKVQNKELLFVRASKYNVIHYCMDIGYQIIMSDDATAVCKWLRKIIKGRYLYSISYGYAAAANLVYDGFCTGFTPSTPTTVMTTPTTPTTPTTTTISPTTEKPKPQDCGRSESLKAKVLFMLNLGQGRIIGGSTVKDCSVIPWQVRVQVRNFLCGGSIIGERYILTASHCLENARSPRDVKVVLAEHHLYEAHFYQQVVPVRNITTHHDFQLSNFVSDIAVLTLKYPIEFNNPCLGIICRNPNFEFDGKSCFVSGWGTVKANGSASSILKVVKVQTHRGSNCDREFGIKDPEYVYNKEQMICAGHVVGGKDACQGDSGNALVCLDTRTDRFVQVGVVSYGKGCGEVGYPGVYSNVIYFHYWINKIMAENNY